MNQNYTYFLSDQQKLLHSLVRCRILVVVHIRHEMEKGESAALRHSKEMRLQDTSSWWAPLFGFAFSKLSLRQKLR